MSSRRLCEGLRYLALLFLAVWNVHADVLISGRVSGDAQKNVQLMLSLTREKCTAPEWKIQGLFDDADQQINQALRALGYYHPHIKKTLEVKPSCWHADFEIDPGPRVTIADISIKFTGAAQNDAEFQQLRSSLLSESGQPLRHDHYESMKSRISALANARGYLNGDFVEKKLLIDTRQNKAYISLVFDAHERMRFGEVKVIQNDLNPDLVNKFITFKSNDFYSSDALAKTHNALSNSGYFEVVDIRPDTQMSNQDSVPVTVNLYPKKVYHYGFGAGYDTDIGPLLNATFINRRINRRGHFLTANLDLSPVLSTADFEYSIPLTHWASEFFSFGGGLKREHTDTYQSLSTKLSARLKHTYANGWKQTLYLDSVYEDFTTGSISNQVLLLVPGGNWLVSVADNTLRPSRGYRLEVNLAGSYKNPASDLSFAQAYIAGVWMQPLPWDAKFIARTEQAATLVDQFERMPSTYRYYAGGMNSIRGYAYKELGPKDAQENVIGGKFLSVLSAEYEQSILENWAIAAFVDTGNAFNLDAVQLKTGAGLGLRWYSPIGLIRLDFAVPLSDANSSFQIHFAAGTRL